MTSDDPNPLEAGMPSCHCDATDRHFTIARARDDLATYHRKGPTGTARLLVACVAELNPLPDSLLDVGAGIGVLHHELLDRGGGAGRASRGAQSLHRRGEGGGRSARPC